MEEQNASQPSGQKSEKHEETKVGKKEQARRAAGQKQTMRNLRNWGIAIVVLVGISYGFFVLVRSGAPKGEDFSIAFPTLPASHIPVGTPIPTYNSNPPSSGPHYPQTARSGFREAALPDQNVIHNLEHGDIWIAYHPRIADSVKDGLRKFAAAKVIITPREANDTDIALVAWGRLDAFNIEGDTLSEERVRDFIKRYVNKGPERIPGASGGI